MNVGGRDPWRVVVGAGGHHGCGERSADQLFRGVSWPRSRSGPLRVARRRLPPLHGLLDQPVRMVPRFGQELGVVAEENPDALSGSARALGAVGSGGQPERDAGVAQVVGALRQLKGVRVKGESDVTRSPPGDAVRRGIDAVPLGWATVTMILGVVVATLLGTLWLGRRLGLSGDQPLLAATATRSAAPRRSARSAVCSAVRGTTGARAPNSTGSRAGRQGRPGPRTTPRTWRPLSLW